MDQIDVDEISEIDYLDDPPGAVDVRFRGGAVKRYNATEHPEILEQLNHWTPPTA